MAEYARKRPKKQEVKIINEVTRHNIIGKVIYAAMAALAMCGCANMGSGPQGGDRDIIPPAYSFSKPANSAVMVNPKRVEIVFDEYINLADAQSVVVSPPSEKAAEVKGIGKKVIVDFKDTLRPNTTYTIDFGSNIVDYTEGNALPNYFFEFSTGSVIDSFVVSGFVLDAYSLIPQSGIMVGAYEANRWTDTTFTTQMFDRISITDSKGHFYIRGLKDREYRICAVKDDNTNYHYDAPGEQLAVLAESVRPKMEIRTYKDTTYKRVDRDSLLGLEHTSAEPVDTLIIDSIRTRQYTHFMPDSLEMRLFARHTPLQEMKKYEMKDGKKVVVTMINEKPQKPQLTAINFEREDGWYVLEPSVTTDTLTYWIADTSLLSMDTLLLAIDYLATDTLEQIVETRDTLQILQKKNKKDKRSEQKKKDNSSLLKAKITSNVDLGSYPTIEWKYPIAELDEQKIKVHLRADTTKQSIAFSLVAHEGNRKYDVIGQWTAGESYVIEVDSAAARDIYHNVNDSIALKFREGSEDEYATLALEIKDLPKERVIVELLQNDVVCQRKMNCSSYVKFDVIKPGSYVIRMIVDADNDGEWSSGDFEKGIEPEMVYFFEKQLSMSANWDYSETWVVNALPLCRQRPQSSYSTAKRKR